MLSAAVLAGACGGAPIVPSPPAPGAPQLTCPADVSLQSPQGTSLAVNFAVPAATDGAPPVSVACAPATGAAFPVGKTTVSCTATDAQQRTASCSFSVTVQAPPRLSMTRFVPFGDSITEGKVATFAVSPLFDQPNSYPQQLTTLLASRYTAQQFVMINEGWGGEDVMTGVGRLPSVINADQPQVLLLQEGANDLFSGNAAAIPGVVGGLRTMIQTARARGVQVFVGTLLPQREGLFRAGGYPLVVPANDLIRSMVAAEGAQLVDLYVALDKDRDTLIGPDGLHPTVAGYQRIAQVFFDALRARFEVAAADAAGKR